MFTSFTWGWFLVKCGLTKKEEKKTSQHVSNYSHVPSINQHFKLATISKELSTKYTQIFTAELIYVDKRIELCNKTDKFRNENSKEF